MRRAIFMLTAALGLCGAAHCQPLLHFAHSRIDTTLDGWHATTRGTIRLVFVHRGRWLVFRGRPNTYHFSDDGLTWTRTEAEQASRSHFIDGDTIYTQYSVDTDPAPDKWDFRHYVAVGRSATRRSPGGRGRSWATGSRTIPTSSATPMAGSR